MKAKSTYRLDGNFSAQLAELFRTNVVFILPPPYLTFVHVFVDFDFVLPCAK
mgnify:CR=1 FL=1|jgi:hypothetical protein